MKKATFYYDGDCPFCNRYSKLQQIRQCLDLQLKNAREDTSWQKINPNIKLDDGVILIDHTNAIYQGVDAIAYLDNICKFKGLFFHLQKWVFSTKFLGEAVYYCLKILRKIALKF